MRSTAKEMSMTEAEKKAEDAVAEAMAEVRSKVVSVPQKETTVFDKAQRLLAVQQQVKNEVDTYRRKAINQHRARLVDINNDYEARVEQEVARLTKAMRQELQEVEEAHNQELHNLDQLLRKVFG
jgi:hypothetical protein